MKFYLIFLFILPLSSGSLAGESGIKMKPLGCPGPTVYLIEENQQERKLLNRRDKLQKEMSNQNNCQSDSDCFLYHGHCGTIEASTNTLKDLWKKECINWQGICPDVLQPQYQKVLCHKNKCVPVCSDYTEGKVFPGEC